MFLKRFKHGAVLSCVAISLVVSAQGAPVESEGDCLPAIVADLVGPVDGSTGVSTAINLQWTRRCIYNVNVTLTGGGETIKALGVSNNFDPPGYLKPGTAYTWKVEFQKPSECECGQGSNVQTWSFVTAAGATPTATPTPVPEVPRFKLQSPNTAAPGFFGRSVAAMPDVNGDGRSEIIIGADLENNLRKVYVYSGADRSLLRTLNTANPGGVNSGNFGRSLSAVPDVNGDGKADIVVGDPDQYEFGGGYAYIYSGATGGFLATLNANVSSGFGLFGHSVAGLDDLNADSIGDVAVGMYTGPFDQPWYSGRVQTYSGTGSSISYMDSPRPVGGGGFGFSLAAAPDVDGDGAGDLLIGAPFELEGGDGGPSVGRAYLFSGRIDSAIFEFNTLNGEEDGRFGYSVASVPDVNSDGFADCLVGAPYENSNSNVTDVGRVYIFSGASGQLISQVQGDEFSAFSLFGFSVAGLRDFNGNGTGDLLVGAPGEEIVGVGAGAAYIIDGGTLQVIAKLLPSSFQPASNFGACVASAGDLDGDSKGDAIVGAPGEDVGYPTISFDAGAAYVNLSGPGGGGRAVGDYDNSGCTDLADFLTLVDNWQLPYEGGDPITLADFLNLVDNWQLGPECD